MRLHHAVPPIPAQAVPVAALHTTVVWKAYVVAVIAEAVRCVLPVQRPVAAVPVVLRHTTVAVRPPHALMTIAQTLAPVAVLMIIIVLPATAALPVTAILPAEVRVQEAIHPVAVVEVTPVQAVAVAVLPAEAVAEEGKHRCDSVLILN